MLFKERCLFCDVRCEKNIAVCNQCISLLPWKSTGCAQCGTYLEKTMSVCGGCLTNAPCFHSTISLFDYATPISHMIHRLKFHRNLRMGKIFGKLWVSHLEKNNLDLPDCIIPVPLHFKRLKERGFNQAIEIAKPISKHFGIPLDIKSCIRIKNLAPQSSLSARKRKRNLHHAFALTRSLNVKHVAILDDVMTTGSTINEIAGLLKTQGVEKIEAWACARVSSTASEEARAQATAQHE